MVLLSTLYLCCFAHTYIGTAVDLLQYLLYQNKKIHARNKKYKTSCKIQWILKKCSIVRLQIWCIFQCAENRQKCIKNTVKKPRMWCWHVMGLKILESAHLLTSSHQYTTTIRLIGCTNAKHLHWYTKCTLLLKESNKNFSMNRAK